MAKTLNSVHLIGKAYNTHWSQKESGPELTLTVATFRKSKGGFETDFHHVIVWKCPDSLRSVKDRDMVEVEGQYRIEKASNGKTYYNVHAREARLLTESPETENPSPYPSPGFTEMDVPF